MSGLGAWSFGFYHYQMQVPNNRVAAGITAFKQALIDNGFGKNVDISIPKFGEATKNRVVEFQTQEKIKADGVIGPETARHLMRRYSFNEEVSDSLKIPDHLLQKLLGHESGYDPVAEGYVDPEDEGIAQISLKNHPDVTELEAWAPSFAIPFAGDYLKKFYKNSVADFDAAVASYNVGTFYAVKWAKAGKPSSGLIVNIGGKLVDVYTRATAYVAGVKAMPI